MFNERGKERIKLRVRYVCKLNLRFFFFFLIIMIKVMENNKKKEKK